MNHFWEIGKDENNDAWVTVHSGSRNLGLKIATYWQNVAKKDSLDRIAHCNEVTINEIKTKFPKKQWEYKINEAKAVSQGLEYLENDHMIGYFMDSIFAHFYAKINREIMLYEILKILGINNEPEEVITSVHNYIDFKDMVIRKGAISSYLKQPMLIPFNMEDGILICLGRSNADWNFSAPHGAGRMGSRTWAKEQFNSEDTKKRMIANGIFSSVVPADEVKEAYKSSEIIEKAISPTAYIVGRIKPLINFKSK